MKTFLPVSALLTVVWAVAPAAFADPLTLPKTDVQASSESDLSASGYQQPLDSTTTRLGLTPKETPQGVTSRSREQLNDFNLTSVKDALRSAPSVTVELGSERFRARDHGARRGAGSALCGARAGAAAFRRLSKEDKKRQIPVIILLQPVQQRLCFP